MFTPLPKCEIGVVVALASEAAGFLTTRGERDPFAKTGDVRLIVAGIGYERAAAASRCLVEQGARLLVSWGVAGGLSPLLKPGDILLPPEVVAQDYQWSVDAAWRERFERALEPCGCVVSGKLWCSPAPMASVAGKAALATQDLAAVDMESAAVAAVAASVGVPFVAVKVICEPAHHEIPAAALQMIGPTGHTRLRGIPGVVLAGPQSWRQMLALRSDFSIARRTLRRAASAVSQ